ncbi:shikimate kinase [Candidatus Syntrophocurvum alkaliphilum]|nr:shikimate kinase [Candidatus Syntrophocurvum alkaliphilum]
MGTGKSTIGYKLASRLNKQFVDMDREIEKVTGMTVADLFRQYGEIRFRSEERLMAKKLSVQNDIVIATGGGVVLDPENINAFKENGIIVWLDASPEIIFERVNRKKGTRPLLRKKTSIEDIEKFSNEREPHYSCADYRFDTGKNLDEVVEEIIKVIKDKI